MWYDDGSRPGPRPRTTLMDIVNLPQLRGWLVEMLTKQVFGIFHAVTGMTFGSGPEYPLRFSG